MFGPWWSSGRGWGWGARLGYCPWTGMPRGWRWYGAPYYGTWPYYGNYYPAYNYATTPSGWPYYSIYSYGTAQAVQVPGFPSSSEEALENEYKYLQERMEEVKKRLGELRK